LRWSRIESYAWLQAKSESVVLTVRLKKSLFQFPWTYRIVLTAAEKSLTNAIVGRQLSQWPWLILPIGGLMSGLASNGTETALKLSNFETVERKEMSLLKKSVFLKKVDNRVIENVERLGKNRL
jgi:hypothetical protein